MQTRVDTTFSGKDISSAAVSVYEYTIPTSTRYSFQVRLAAVAGGGDYTCYLTLNDGDVQSDDPVVPKTTYEAEVGETAFWFNTIDISFIAGDVVNIMVLGQAGDTNEAGSVRIFSENYARVIDILSDSTAFNGSMIDVTISSRSPFDSTSDQVIVATNNDKTGYALSAAGIDSIWDEVIELTYTARKLLRLIASALFGKVTGGGTVNPKFRDLNDSKDRIDATTDASGNRTSVTLDGD